MDVVFSVIVPVYNVEDFLPRCLDSIVRQGCKKYEVIMVDDGSTDSSGIICDQYAERYPQCRVIHQENKGISAARNAGLEYARGKYIVFVDSDDYIEKELLTKAYYYMEEQGYEACSFAARRVSEAGVSLYDMRFFEAVGTYSLSEKNREEFLLTTFLQYGLGWEVWMYVYRKDIIDRSRIRFAENIGYAEDLLFSFEYMKNVKSLNKIPDILYNYTLREVSATGTTDAHQLVRGVFEDVFSIMQSGIVENEGYLYYAALLNYFVPAVLQEIDMAELRVYMNGLDSLHMQQKQWEKIVRCYSVIESSFGTDGKKIYDIATYLLGGTE